jgi:formate hydrogenlyase subunit 3/multisubunit Na+/H+ antiporter MnhD subunit
MIIALIFFGHLIFALVIFTKKWQDENLSTAFLNVALILILFAVGWSLAGIIAKLILEPKGFGYYLDRDAFSLLLLTAGEYFFYRIYYKEKPMGNGEAAEEEKG